MNAPLDLSGEHPMLRRRPKTRGECAGGFRPCPWVSCRQHLANDVTPHGRLRIYSDPDDWTDETQTCALDVADDGPHTLEAVAAVMGGLSRERIRQIETAALDYLRNAASSEDLHDHLDTHERSRPDLQAKPTQPPHAYISKAAPSPKPTPTRSQHMPRDANTPLRHAAIAAARRLREIIDRRKIPVTSLARKAAALSGTPRSDDQAVNLLNTLLREGRPSIVTEGWTLACAALGISLRDLSSDAAWIAAQPQITPARKPEPPKPPASRFFSGPLLSDSIPADDEDEVVKEVAEEVAAKVSAKASAEDSIDDGPAAALDAPTADDDDPQDDTDMTTHITGEPPTSPPPVWHTTPVIDPARALGLAIINALDAPRREADAARDAAVAEALEIAARAQAEAATANQRAEALAVRLDLLTARLDRMLRALAE